MGPVKKHWKEDKRMAVQLQNLNVCKICFQWGMQWRHRFVDQVTRLVEQDRR